MANTNLHQAKNAKNDEFYTQWADIEREVQAYLEFDPDVFRDKTILCPCDDPEWSNFTKFFALHFEEFGLKKLISTSYAYNSKNYKTKYKLSSFEESSPKFDKRKTKTKGKLFVLERKDCTKINIDDLNWDYMSGDGDFRSDEVKKLRDEADIIITNPPFSLFREFLAWIVEVNKQFLIIGNMNAITYKEVFPLIAKNKIWLGVRSGAKEYMKPDKTMQKMGNTCWITNIDHGRRHQPLPLMTMKENIKFNKSKKMSDKKTYVKYDNYDAIEVPEVVAIPSDYDGVMGVPVSFLDKYCPEQFEILGTSDNGIIDDKYKLTQGLTQKFVDDYYAAGGKGTYKGGNPTAGIYNNGIAMVVYKRLFIKHKGVKNENGTQKV